MQQPEEILRKTPIPILRAIYKRHHLTRFCRKRQFFNCRLFLVDVTFITERERAQKIGICLLYYLVSGAGPVDSRTISGARKRIDPIGTLFKRDVIA